MSLPNKLISSPAKKLFAFDLQKHQEFSEELAVAFDESCEGTEQRCPVDLLRLYDLQDRLIILPALEILQ